MALVKIYATLEKRNELIEEVSGSIKYISAAALNIPEIPTVTSGVETVFAEGIDLVGIDYILEIIAVERPNQQMIAESIIAGLNTVYPDKLFSVYFNNIREVGMAHTPRQKEKGELLTMDEAIKRSKHEI